MTVLPLLPFQIETHASFLSQLNRFLLSRWLAASAIQAAVVARRCIPGCAALDAGAQLLRRLSSPYPPHSRRGVVPNGRRHPGEAPPRVRSWPTRATARPLQWQSVEDGGPMISQRDFPAGSDRSFMGSRWVSLLPIFPRVSFNFDLDFTQ
jgi:hypothetical protein